MENNIFDSVLSIFNTLFQSIDSVMYATGTNLVNTILAPMVTLVIIFWAGKKMKEGDFQIPQDVFNIFIFLLLNVFVITAINNPIFYKTYVLGVIDIPVNIIQEFVFSILSDPTNSNTQTIGMQLEIMLKHLFDMYILYSMPDMNWWDKITSALSGKMLLNLILWLVYLFFGMILFLSMATTITLTFLQILFWKPFGTILLPLLYFKATRTMVFAWIKTIIALGLIQILILIVGAFDNIVEKQIASVFQSAYAGDGKSQQIDLIMVTALILTKFISISFLKEIAPMVNSMLGTNAASGTGQFANSFAMSSAAAAGAGAGFVAAKGAMGIGKGAGNIAQGLGKTAMDTKAGQAVSNKIANSKTGQAISSGYGAIKDIGNGISRGVGNLTQGKSWKDK